MDALRKKGIEVCCVDMDNPKAPIHFVFVNHPFDARAVLAELHDIAGLSADRNGSVINSSEYVWIGFEADVADRHSQHDSIWRVSASGRFRTLAVGPPPVLNGLPEVL